MFRKFILAALVVTSAAFAQIGVGVRAASNVGTLYGDDVKNTSWNVGFNAGVAVKFDVLPIISIISGLEVDLRRIPEKYKRVEEYDGKDLGLEDVGVFSIDWDVEEDLTMWYLDIPVFARFNFIPMFHFDFGAYFAFNLSSNIHYKQVASYGVFSASESGDVDISKEVKTFDAGLLAGAGVSILPGMLDIDFRLTLGFAGVDLAGKNDEAVWVNHLRMQLGATFWFM